MCDNISPYWAVEHLAPLSAKTKVFTICRNEEENNIRHATMMHTILQHREKIQALEAECHFIRTHFSNLKRGAFSSASHYKMSADLVFGELKEEKTVHQVHEDVDKENKESQPSFVSQNEAHSTQYSRFSLRIVLFYVLQSSFNIRNLFQNSP